MTKEKAAKLIRIITVPPLMVTARILRRYTKRLFQIKKLMFETAQ